MPCTHISTPKLRNSEIVDWLNGYCFEVSSLWVEYGSPLYELKREFCIEFGVEEAFIPYDTILVFWLGLLLFREEFGMLLA